MNIKELEMALKNIVGGNSPRLALSSLSGNGELSSEFATAARTFASRQEGKGSKSLLQFNSQGW